jgi:hypothetical protein
MSGNPPAFTATPASIGAAAAAAVPWQPSDNGLLACSAGDPALLTSTAIMTAGTLYLARLPVRAAITITNLIFEVSAVAVGASAGTFAGLYSSAGVLLSGSADVNGSFLAAGPATCALSAPQSLAAGGFVWAALLANFATTQPTLLKGATATGNVPNVGLSAAAYRFAVNGTVLASLPGSVTPASNSAAGLLTLWCGAN